MTRKYKKPPILVPFGTSMGEIVQRILTFYCESGKIIEKEADVLLTVPRRMYRSFKEP